MIFPQWTLPTILLYAYLAFMAINVFFSEYFGWFEMQYSKFRAKKGIPTRTGMLILYFVPLVFLFIYGRTYLAQPTFVQSIVFGAVAFHFIKRCLEVLFVHNFSGPMALPTVFIITGLYSLVASLSGYLNRNPLEAPDGLFYAGIGIYVIGILGNFYHHKILADLRKDGSKEYKIPQSGLFKYVACPHYLFEILIWVGIFLLSRHFGVFLCLAFIISYLSARSLKTLKWYQTKFTDYPKDRKAFIPFIL